jgi:hypothetical protein
VAGGMDRYAGENTDTRLPFMSYGVLSVAS